MKFPASPLRSSFLVLAIVLTLLSATSCSEPKGLGDVPSADGTMLSVTEAVDPTVFGRTVRVQGTIHRVCQDEGCWMTITDGSSYLRMTFKNEAFYVPTTLQGEVVVEGVVQEAVYDEDVAKAIAGTIGLTEDEINDLNGDQRLPMMVSTGVLYLNAE